MRSDHGEGNVTQGADAERVGRTEGEQHARCGGHRHSRRLEDVAQRHVEASSSGIDRRGLRTKISLGFLQPFHDALECLIPGDSLEVVTASWTDSAQWIEEPVRIVDYLR